MENRGTIFTKYLRDPLTICRVLVLIPLSSGTLLAAEETVAIDTGTTAWMLTSTALVLLMVPGLAMFYGGLVRTKKEALHPDPDGWGLLLLLS